MKLIKKIEKQSDLLVYGMIALMSLLYGFMSVRHLNQFQTMGWDLAIFDQGIWQWSQFKFPYSSFHDLPWLADHFHLSLVLLAPFYWFFSNVKMLLILQAVLVCLGALPLYFLSKKITQHRLFSLSLSWAYLVYCPLQWFIFSGFHELALLPLFLGGVLYFREMRLWWWYWLSFALAFLVKEEIGFLLAAFGFSTLLRDQKNIKESILTIFLGVVGSLLLIYKIMPAIGAGSYRHAGFGITGETPLEVLNYLVNNPFFIIKAFTDSSVKLKTMLTTFWPFGFLPFFAPSTLLPIIEQFGTRFLDYEKTIRWTAYFAYSLPMATLVAWGSIYGFRNLIGKRFQLGVLVSFMLLFLVIVENYVFHAPINSLFKEQFYRDEIWMEDNLKVLNCVPEGVSVSAQNSLAPWLSQREKIKVFPEGIGYDYLVLDLHVGQSENSFHFLGREKTMIVVEDLINRGFYRKVYEEGEAILLKKQKEPEDLIYPFEIEIYEK